MRYYMQVLDVWDLLIEGSELMEMSREEAECMNLRGNMSVTK